MKLRQMLLATVILCFHVSIGLAHCEVPCGIYADQRRFEQMLEDQDTIAKAVMSINDLMPKLADDALSMNQAARWVSTKEDHATNIQHIIAQYFLTQRIKAEEDRYQEKLATAHEVMVAAMKCKQTVDPETAKALRQAILKFHLAYEGKAMPAQP